MIASPRLCDKPPPSALKVAEFSVTAPLTRFTSANVVTMIGSIGANRVESPRWIVRLRTPAMVLPPSSVKMTRLVPSRRVVPVTVSVTDKDPFGIAPAPVVTSHEGSSITAMFDEFAAQIRYSRVPSTGESNTDARY